MIHIISTTICGNLGKWLPSIFSFGNSPDIGLPVALHMLPHEAKLPGYPDNHSHAKLTPGPQTLHTHFPPCRCRKGSHDGIWWIDSDAKC